MSTPKFAKTHNLVAFLDKLEESEGFEGIINFLNASSIRYALTVSPTIYTTCIEQFWATAKVKTVNGERQIQSLVDKKKVIITEMSIRSDLKLEDAEGTDCLPTATIFAELERMGYENLTQKLTFYKAYFSSQWKFLIHTLLQCLSAKTIAWNEFSSTMASAIMVGLSFYVFKKVFFVKVFLDNQVEGMTKHKGIYVTPSHTKKVFVNMKRPGKGFSGKVIPLFQTMMVQAPEDMGEDLTAPTDSHSTPIITQPSSSKPQKKQSRRKQRNDNGPTEPIPDEATNEEHVSTPSYDPPQSGEDRLQLTELMSLCTSLQVNVLDLEKAKTAQAKEIVSLKKRVKQLEKIKKSRTSWLKRLKKVGSASRVESSNEDMQIDINDQVESFYTQDDHHTPSQASQLPQAKDKGKAIMVKPEKPLKKKYQIAIAIIGWDTSIDVQLYFTISEKRYSLEQTIYLQGQDTSAVDRECSSFWVHQTDHVMTNPHRKIESYDEAGTSYDSNTPFEVQDHDTFVNHLDEYHEVHEMQTDEQHNYVVDSDADYTSNSNTIPYD
ncbi:hypothetical protein Tco_1499231 [Tanacetum coccineum]